MGNGLAIASSFRGLQLDMATVAEAVQIFKENHFELAARVDTVVALIGDECGLAKRIVSEFKDILTFLAGLVLVCRGGDLKRRTNLLYEIFDLENRGSLSRNDLVVMSLCSQRALGLLTGTTRCKLLDSNDGPLTKDSFYELVLSSIDSEPIASEIKRATAHDKPAIVANVTSSPSPSLRLVASPTPATLLYSHEAPAPDELTYCKQFVGGIAEAKPPASSSYR